jgi:hypothetical protein
LGVAGDSIGFSSWALSSDGGISQKLMRLEPGS